MACQGQTQSDLGHDNTVWKEQEQGTKRLGHMCIDLSGPLISIVCHVQVLIVSLLSITPDITGSPTEDSFVIFMYADLGLRVEELNVLALSRHEAIASE